MKWWTVINPKNYNIPNKFVIEIPWKWTIKFCCITTTQWIRLRRFVIDSTSKLHVESPSRFHQFWKTNPGENYDIDSTWKFCRGFDFQSWQNIDEFSTWNFLCCLDVKATKLLYLLFPFYHFRTFSALWTYCKLIWYSAELM